MSVKTAGEQTGAKNNQTKVRTARGLVHRPTCQKDGSQEQKKQPARGLHLSVA